MQFSHNAPLFFFSSNNRDTESPFFFIYLNQRSSVARKNKDQIFTLSWWNIAFIVEQLPHLSRSLKEEI